MRYLEDFEVGQTFRFRAEALSRDDIVAFATEYDPQPIHIDEAYAKTMHGGLIASGFQTMLRSFKPVMSELMADTANIGGLGFEEMKWPRPVRPGEALDVEMRVESLTPSRSKPDRGVMAYAIEARNPEGEVVFTTRTLMMARRRASGDAE